jgi:DNA polymerase elongation subunit (family B)
VETNNIPKRDLNSFVVASYDIETDPFKAGRVPKPFAWGFHVINQTIGGTAEFTESEMIAVDAYNNAKTKAQKLAVMKPYKNAMRNRSKRSKKISIAIEESYTDFWSLFADKCTASFIDHLESLERPHLIFAHNGGKFDYMYLREHIRGKVFIIGGRLVEWEYTTKKGVTHVLRDSYAILPVPLSSGGGKLDIDYSKLEKKVRTKNKVEIMQYMKQDCVALSEMVMAFKEKYGKFFLTIGSACFDHLKKMYPLEKTSYHFDQEMRKYYYGGRCQTFEGGEINEEVYVYDVNSMYPYVMANYTHPYSPNYVKGKKITDDTYFIKWTGTNHGAVPYRKEDGSLTFDQPHGTFFTTIHEWRIALKYNLIEVEEIHETIDFFGVTKLDDYVNEGNAEKVKTKSTHGNKSNAYTLCKLHLNSPYGKYAQDNLKFKTWNFVDPDTACNQEGATVIEGDEFTMIGLPSNAEPEKTTFNNTATGASITGASRAVLLEANIQMLKAGARLLYNDTDSIICTKPQREVEGLEMHPEKLGAWDLEAVGDKMYIAGKKIYAIYKGENCIKIATKGVRVTPRDIHEFLPHDPSADDIKSAKQQMLNIGGGEIKNVALGGDFLFENDAPSMKIDGRNIFIHRIMKNTFKESVLPKVYKLGEKQ